MSLKRKIGGLNKEYALENLLIKFEKNYPHGFK
jgi:hypothetical protein